MQLPSSKTKEDSPSPISLSSLTHIKQNQLAKMCKSVAVRCSSPKKLSLKITFFPPIAALPYQGGNVSPHPNNDNQEKMCGMWILYDHQTLAEQKGHNHNACENSKVPLQRILKKASQMFGKTNPSSICKLRFYNAVNAALPMTWSFVNQKTQKQDRWCCSLIFSLA